MGARKKTLQASPAEGLSSVWLAVLIGFLTFLLYLPSLRSGFVYDAESQILIGDYIHQPRNFVEVVSLRVMSRDVLDFNRPVQLFSLMVDSLFWKKNPLGYHLTSNLLHALTTALLFLVAVRLLDSRKIAAAFLAALIFAIHPLLVEPVAEVASREDVLAALFVLAALLLAEAFGKSSGRTKIVYGAACTLSAFLACASKETGLAVLPLLGLYWLLYRWPEPKGPWLGLLMAVFTVSAAFFVARFALEPKNSQIFLHPPVYIGGSFGMVFQIQPRIWAFLLGLIFWPLHLSADYVPQNVHGITLPMALAVLAAFVALQGWLAWKSRIGAMGAFLFWLALAPVSNFIPIFRPMADRFMYLPLAGFVLMLAGALALARPRVFRGLAVVCALVILFLAGLTWQRQAVFADSLSLWQDTLKKSPFSDTAANNLGYALMDHGDYDPALQAFQQALNITQGRKADAWAGAAITLEKFGRPADAENALRQAITNDPMYATPQKLVEALTARPEHAAVMEQIRSRLAP